MTSLPKTQKAAVKQGSGNDSTTKIIEIPVPTPGPGQILVKIHCTGLCASDKSLIHDEWSAFGLAMMAETEGIAGHEGAGVVAALGPDVERTGLWKIGDRAGVKWIASTCGVCDMCKTPSGEVNCPNQKNSGFTAAGTFQEYCLADARYTTKLPDGVSDEEAGPIMCGGVTAYNACKRSGVLPGQWVTLIGAGGGLGHLAIQYAKAMGMRVIAVDGGQAKRELCTRLGAEHFVDFTQTKDLAAEVMKLTTNGSHGVIVTAAAKSSYEVAPMVLRPGGTMVCVGLPTDPSVVAGAPPMVLCLRKLNVLGSVVGTLRDVEECLDFTARGLVHPVLTRGTLGDLNKLCDDMKKGQLPGRAVLRVAA